MQGLETAVDKASNYKGQWEDVGRQLQAEQQLARDHCVRADQTTQQQTKLIDFLHTKLEDKMKKKKVQCST